MLMINAENHCNTRKICIFGQTNKQPLCNFEGWVLTLVAYFKKCKSKKKKRVKHKNLRTKRAFLVKQKIFFLIF